ncbi:MAG: acetyl esterase [Saprospiraceae bacterium]
MKKMKNTFFKIPTGTDFRSLKTQIVILLLVLPLSCHIFGQRDSNITEEIYKKVDTTSLSMEIHYPSEMEDGKRYPAMIFYFGGGWNGGSISQFRPHAEYFSSRGLICVLADYRVKSRQGATPFQSLKDANSAIRYLRIHADRLHIDQYRIIGSGGSAGGHLAAATAMTNGFLESGEDVTVSTKPNALVLFNPVIDNGPGGYGYDRIGPAYKEFSPLHNIQEGTPPTIIFCGTDDKLIPVATLDYYKTVMEKVGSRCDLHLYPNQTHGFFNYAKRDNYNKTVIAADNFLSSLGYITGEPTIVIKK